MKTIFDHPILKCFTLRMHKTAKVLLWLPSAALLLSACDQKLAFQDQPLSCEPPQSSARYGNNPGPVITEPKAHQPFNAKMKIAGTCANGAPIEIRGKGVATNLTTTCASGKFSTVVEFNKGDGFKELDVVQKSSAGEDILDRQCFDQDTVPPQVKINGAGGAQAVGSRTVRLEGTCESNLEVIVQGPQLKNPVTAQCRGGRFSTDITFTGNDGLKDVVARQVDRAGNHGEDDKQYNTDTTAPIVTITTPSAGTATRGEVRLAGSCESGLRVIIQGDLRNPVQAVDCTGGLYSATIVLSQKDGAKDIEVSQTDMAGNIGRANTSALKDGTAPDIRILSPQPNTVTTGALLMTGACESGLPVTLIVTGQTKPILATCVSNQFQQDIALPSPDGAKIVTASQVDSVGNIGSDSRSFVRDTSVPMVTITSPAENSVWRNSVLLQGTCENRWAVHISGAGHKSPGAAPCKNGAFSVEVTFSEGDGPKNIVVSQKAENGNSSSANRTFIKDTTAPAVAFTSPTANTPGAGNLGVKGTCETGLVVVLTGDIVTPNTVACTAGQFATNVVFTAQLGDKKVTASQTDSADNTGSDTRTFINGNNMTMDSFISKGPGGKVDILFVDDNSASMDHEQAALGKKFSAFASTVSSLDWQVGIITTDCTEGSPFNFCGQLHNMSGRPNGEYILTAKTPNSTTVFQNTIQRPETIDCFLKGSCPAGREEGLTSTIQAFKLKDQDNAGFFRHDADLAVIYLTDEDESSNGPPAATTPTQVMNAFRSTWGTSKKFSVYGIIVQPGDTKCWNDQRSQAGNNANYGTFFDQLAKLTSGITVSICAPDYSLTLKEIGENVTRMGKSITLSHTPIANTVRVQFSPDYKTKWSVNGNTLTFDTPAPVGTKVDVIYEYK